MNPRVRPLALAPPFLVGMCAGAIGLLALALLLYSNEGLFRSLTVVTAVEFSALGLLMCPETHPLFRAT